jgi:hypothetical protein
MLVEDDRERQQGFACTVRGELGLEHRLAAG